MLLGVGGFFFNVLKVIMNNLPTIAGMSLVLQSVSTDEKVVKLEKIIDDFDLAISWIPLVPQKGIVKVMPVINNIDNYPQLLKILYQKLTYNTVINWQEKSYFISGIETYKDDLFAINFLIHHQEQLPATIGRAIHALFFKWIEKGNSEIAQKIHEQDIVPFTLSSHYLTHKKTKIQINLLQKFLLSPLLIGIKQDLGTSIDIANTTCKISHQVDLMASNSYLKLTEIDVNQSIILNFLSPTSFKQQKQIQLFLTPELVFNSLLRKWNNFAPNDLHFPEIQWEGIVTAFDLKTHALKMEGGAELGSQGWVKYKFCNSEQAKIASILSQFAFYAGVGRKTTMGMGQVSKQ